MAITAALVKELREKTGAGMMDCKKALEANDGNIDKSIDWLREQGIAKSAKKSGRIAAEGLSRVKASGNKACLIEVNSETDFVAQNEQFLALMDKVVDIVLNANPTTMEEALKVETDGVTLEQLFIDATATIGEKISFRRFEILEKADDELFGTYMHMGGKISACAVVKSNSEEVAKDMAMQVASMSPQYVSRNDMPKEIIDHERSVQEGLVKNDESLQSKPEKVLLGIVEGRLSKSLQDITLVDQVFFKNQDIKCSQYLKDNNSSVVKFVKYAVGEGIEKREENFAEEVAKQIGK
ncbi:MAG: elongation factor Ts [Erysipelotrichaceae bacterium]|nr:elongation factor Ts [Erysipelotrichaceae bacterium]